MKKIIVLCITFLCANAWATPFLVCDPPPATDPCTVTEYRITWSDGTMNPTPAPLAFDVGHVAPGQHAIEVVAVCGNDVWPETVSEPSPFVFRRPGAPSQSTGLNLVE
jgi:hypothetical protein